MCEMATEYIRQAMDDRGGPVDHGVRCVEVPGTDSKGGTSSAHRLKSVVK